MVDREGNDLESPEEILGSTVGPLLSAGMAVVAKREWHELGLGERGPTAPIEGLGDMVGPGDLVLVRTFSDGVQSAETEIELIDCWIVGDGIWQFLYNRWDRWLPGTLPLSALTSGAGELGENGPWYRRFEKMQKDERRVAERRWRYQVSSDPIAAFLDLQASWQTSGLPIQSILELAAHVVAVLQRRIEALESEKELPWIIVAHGRGRSDRTVFRMSGTSKAAVEQAGQLSRLGASTVELYDDAGCVQAYYVAEDMPEFRLYPRKRSDGLFLELVDGRDKARTPEPVVEVFGRDDVERMRRAQLLIRGLSPSVIRDLDSEVSTPRSGGASRATRPVDSDHES